MKNKHLKPGKLFISAETIGVRCNSCRDIFTFNPADYKINMDRPFYYLSCPHCHHVNSLFYHLETCPCCRNATPRYGKEPLEFTAGLNGKFQANFAALGLQDKRKSDAEA